jgi:hypothetical protein
MARKRSGIRQAANLRKAGAHQDKRRTKKFDQKNDWRKEWDQIRDSLRR